MGVNAGRLFTAGVIMLVVIGIPLALLATNLDPIERTLNNEVRVLHELASSLFPWFIGLGSLLMGVASAVRDEPPTSRRSNPDLPL